MPKDRLEAFSDGVFAIAITLLVLDIAVPDPSGRGLAHDLAAQWPAYAAYGSASSRSGSSGSTITPSWRTWRGLTEPCS